MLDNWYEWPDHALDWIDRHAVAWWHDSLDIITNNTRDSPNVSQTELAFTIILLFVLFLTNVVIAAIMIKRHPLLLLDKALLARELFFGFLFGTTLYVFYSHRVFNIYFRNVIYSGLIVASILVIVSSIRENTMTAAEVERERQERLHDLERRNHG